MTNPEANHQRSVCVISILTVVLLGAATASLAAKPVKQTFFLPDTGLVIGECDGFEIINVADLEITVTSFFSNDGDFIRERVMFRVRNSVYFNSVNPDISLDGGPGEVEVSHFDAVDNTLSFKGAPFKVTVPGSGVIYLQAGRTFIDLNTGEVTTSGPSDFDDGNVDELCDALTQI